MNLRKYQQGYLGSQSNTLDERVTQRCGGTQIPYPNFLVGDPESALASATGRIKPKVAALDTTRGIVFYSNSSQNILYYRVITVSTDGTTTWGSEGTLVTGQGFITSWGVCNIYDDKVLVCYKHVTGGTNTYCDVGTVDGSGNMTFATPTSVDTTHAPDSSTKWYDLVKVEDGRALLAAINTDNAKVGLQVIDVDVSDNITSGSVAKTTAVNKTVPKIAVLSATSGIINTAASSLCSSEKFTISGTTITLNGTEYIFTNPTQYPVESDLFYLGDAVAVSSSKQSLVGGAAIAASRYPLNSMLVLDTSGVLSSAAVLEDLTSVDYTSAPSTVTMSSYYKGSSIYILAITEVSSTYTLKLIRHSDADPPTYVADSLVATDTQILEPDSTQVGSDYGINVWRQNDGVNSWIAVNGVYFNPKA